MFLMTKKRWFYSLIQWIFLGILWFLLTQWQQKEMLASDHATKAPSFSLRSIKGKQVNFFSKKQNKKILLYFFAPWCAICHASIDNIEEIKRSFKDEIIIYAIALDWKNEQAIHHFLKSHTLSMPILLGTSSVKTNYKISGYPSYYIIGKDGMILSKDKGYTTEIGMRLRLL
jgi:peroxiredoxin